MKVVLDARMAGHSGIGTYIRHLIAHTPASIDLTLLGDPALLSMFRRPVIRSRAEIYGLREQWEIPALARRAGADVLHVPHYNVPMGWKGPLIVTVHDVIPLLFPRMTKSVLSQVYLRASLFVCARRARAVAADSECTKKDLLHFGLPERLIHVVPLAPPDAYSPADGEKSRAVAASYGLTPGYLLYVGNLRPLKNLERLVQAYGRLRATWPGAPLLALAGRMQMKNADWLPSDGSVRAIGEVPGEHLPFLYSAASVFVFPSLYEGFGLPPLEAMACGCPVASSNAGSLPEVLGDAAVFFDPYRVDEMAAAIQRVLTDRDLRRKLAEKGFERVRLFSWKKAAEKTAQLYASAASRGRTEEARR